MDRLHQLLRHVATPAAAAAAAQPTAADAADIDNTPVLIGVARVTPRIEMTADAFPPSPTDHIEEMARMAARDSGLDEAAVLAASKYTSTSPLRIGYQGHLSDGGPLVILHSHRRCHL